MSALSAEELVARYAGQASAYSALSGVSVDLEPGERLLLLGPNGAGKSTFIRVFAGLMRPTQGRALIAGQPARSARAQVGVVGHATHLYEELTAAENLRLYAELYGVVEVASRVSELLEQVGVGRLANEQVGRLSRGQQQRVALARALLHEPEVLLLDEPDTGLDVGAYEMLERLLVGGRRTVVLTTHNLAIGVRLGTRAAVLARGHLVDERRSLTGADAGELNSLLEGLARA